MIKFTFRNVLYNNLFTFSFFSFILSHSTELYKALEFYYEVFVREVIGYTLLSVVWLKHCPYKMDCSNGDQHRNV